MITLPNIKYTSGDFTTPVAVSLPVFDAPFKEDGINIDYVLTQDFMCNQNDFAREAIDTPHPDFPEFLLAVESEQRDVGGGKVRWTRTYLKLPAEYEKPSGNFSFTYPALSGPVTGGFVGAGGDLYGRLPETRTTRCKRVRTFYHTADPFTDIPNIPKFQSYITGGPAPVATDIINQTGTGYTTDPTRDEWDALVEAGEWIVAQDSTWDIWIGGNFYLRETFYVPAQ